MSDIDALRQRVEAAERSFGLIDERDRNYSARLITLISNIEGQVSGHQAEIAERESRLANLERENGEMRAMLHSLLLAIEDGGKDRIGATVNDMDHRITSLLAGQAEEPAQADQGETDPADTAETPDAMSDDEVAAELPEDAGLDEISDPLEESAAEASQPEESVPDDEPEVPETDDATAEAEAEAAETEPEAAEAEPDMVESEPEAAEAEPEAAMAEPDTTESEPEAAAVNAADSPSEDQALPGAEASEEDLLAALAEPIDGDAAVATDQEGASAPDDQEADGDADLDLSIMEADPAPCEPAATENEAGTADLEGTDVVMAASAPEEDLGDGNSGAEETDPALAARAEKIAELLSSGDDSDPSVKEIIDKVTELAATLEGGAKAAEPADDESAAEMEADPEPVPETTAA